MEALESTDWQVGPSAHRRSAQHHIARDFRRTLRRTPVEATPDAPNDDTTWTIGKKEHVRMRGSGPSARRNTCA